jgi:hypothetical protein
MTGTPEYPVGTAQRCGTLHETNHNLMIKMLSLSNSRWERIAAPVVLS